MKKKIGILMGGTSSERDISLKTSASMLQHLDNEKFEAIPIEINEQSDVLTKCQNIDFALIGLHGRFGEDGCVQAILETMNIPYSGCGVLASALSMDKDMTKKIVRHAGIRTADWCIVTTSYQLDYLDAKYPLFVKPNSGGSSVATSLVKDASELKAAFKEALRYDREVMIETCIQGEEISVPMIDGKIYPIIAIKPKGAFFDKAAKYETGDAAADEFIVEFDEPLKSEIEWMLNETWRALKLEGYARIDFIIEDNVPYLLEVNTLPGMTETSLMPQSCAHAGLAFTDLLTHLIDISSKIKR